MNPHAALALLAVLATSVLHADAGAQIPGRPDGSTPPAASNVSVIAGTIMEGARVTRDIDYLANAEHADGRDRLDIYMPPNATDAPVVVYLHGGQLTSGDKSEGEALAARLLAHGIGLVSANYRLSPAAMHPAHMQDASAAVAWVLDHIAEHGGDPERVYVGGWSAGAYLAALMAVDPRWLGDHGRSPDEIRGWPLVSPFLYTEETAPDRPKTIWGEDPAVWLLASVSPYIRAALGPMLLVYADGDDAWRKEQNERFAAALRSAGNRDVRITEVPNRSHVGLVRELGNPDDRIGDLVTGFVLAHPAPARVSGPIPVRARPGDPSNDIIHSMSGMDLVSHEYVEEEFFIEGEAYRYSSPELATGEVVGGPHPYRTRFIVRRPRDGARFNGTVVVEWNNVTAGQDIDIDWLQMGEHLMRNGYAWVGVSAQRVGVDYLREWSPARYGDLDVTVGGSIEGDALSYDIFSAVADAVRAPGIIDPLAGLEVERVLATGHSQSAGRLATYMNNVHPLRPTFDGVIVHGGGGRIRVDQEVEVFKLMAETDMPRRLDSRQPQTASFVSWEVAGSSHVDIFYAEERAKVSAAMAGRDPLLAEPRIPTCDRPSYSRVPFRHVMHAALEHLVRWVEGEALPPRAPVIEAPVGAVPDASGDVFTRDERGNALGGIRLAAHAVPTATNTGINSGEGFCRLYGSHEPFDAATLAGLYESRADYLAKVRATLDANLVDGFILPRDADETMREAWLADVGRR